MPSSANHAGATKAPFAWDGKPLVEARFHARACLLAVVGKQQDPSSLNGNAKERLEDSDDEDSGEDVSDADSVFPEDLVRESGKKKLKDAFLDRLAEVVSREKPKPGEKADHVSATAMVEGDDGATVYVAKNGGLDEVDGVMLRELQIWVRAVAAHGRRRDITKDVLWKKLVEYYQKRLEFYRQRLTERLEPHWTTIDTVYAIEERFHGLAKLRSCLGAVRKEGHEIICAAYELQYDKSTRSDLDEIAKGASRKLWQYILLLGRLRVAYETFVEGALHLASFRKLNIVGRHAGISKGVADRSSCSLPPSVSTDFKRLKSRQQRVCMNRMAKPCFIHAEVQLLMELECHSMENFNAVWVFDYIGCSKRTCYLCCKFIGELGYFRTRGTHGKVYDQWTVPASNDLPVRSTFQIKVALVNIEKDMITRFEECFGSRRLSHVAESSIGNSVHSEISMYRRRLRQVGLDTEGLNAPSSKERGKDSPATKLGKPRKSFRAARIPADSGSLIEIVRLVPTRLRKDTLALTNR